MPGEFIAGLENVLRQFGDFWQVFEKDVHTPTNFTGLFQAFSELVKSVRRGPLLGSFFLDKKLLIVFFLQKRM